MSAAVSKIIATYAPSVVRPCEFPLRWFMSLHFDGSTPAKDPTRPDPQDKVPPVPPEQRRPPVEMPPDQPGISDTEPDPLPKGDPKPNEPTRLV